MKLKALSIWSGFAEKSPTVPAYQRRVAKLHVGLANVLNGIPGKHPEAEEHCRESLRILEQFRLRFPDSEVQQFDEPHAHLWLGSTLTALDRWEEGEQHIRHAVLFRQRMLDVQPDDPGLQSNLGHGQLYLAQCLLRRSEFLEAERVLQSAVEIHQQLVDNFPATSAYIRHLAWSLQLQSISLYGQHRFEEALKAARKAIEMGRSSPGDQYELASLLYRAGEIEEAAELYRSILATFDGLDNDSSLSESKITFLIEFLVNCPLTQFRDPERALKLSNRLLQQHPLSDEGWFLHGMVEYRRKNIDEAIESLNKARTLSQSMANSINVSYFLAMSHHQRGDVDEARRWSEKARTDADGRSGLSIVHDFPIQEEVDRVLGNSRETNQDAKLKVEDKP